MKENDSLNRIKYLVSLFLYGTIGLFVRFVDIPSEAIAFYRGSLGSIFLLGFFLVNGHKIDFTAIKKNLKWLILSGIFLGLNWVFLFASYLKTTVAIGSLCNYTAPMIVVLISPIVLHEKLDVRKIPLIIASFAGVALISGVFDGVSSGADSEGYDHVAGVVLGLLAALCFVGILICNKKFDRIDYLERAFVQLISAACTILPYVIFMNKGVPVPGDLKGIAAILVVGFIYTGFAYIFYFTGIGTLRVETIAILGYLEPVVAILSSLVFLGEPMTVLGWIGAVMILGSAVLAELLPKKE